MKTSGIQTCTRPSRRHHCWLSETVTRARVFNFIKLLTAPNPPSGTPLEALAGDQAPSTGGQLRSEMIFSDPKGNSLRISAIFRATLRNSALFQAKQPLSAKFSENCGDARSGSKFETARYVMYRYAAEPRPIPLPSLLARRLDPSWSATRTAAAAAQVKSQPCRPPIRREQ